MATRDATAEHAEIDADDLSQTSNEELAHEMARRLNELGEALTEIRAMSTEIVLRFEESRS